MDLEALGEHLGKETGVFDFWQTFIDLALAAGVRFLSPGEVIDEFPAEEAYDCRMMSSWADRECDESAWLGNSMQREAAQTVYALERPVLDQGDPKLVRTWGRLQTSDHFYYMATKSGTDGEVHSHFNPHGSPYDYYLYYMNALADLQVLLRGGTDADLMTGSGAQGGLVR